MSQDSQCQICCMNIENIDIEINRCARIINYFPLRFLFIFIFSLYLIDCICFLIEGFGGKRALGLLCKNELCQNRSKFRMQFCLGALNNVLHAFSLKLASFSKYYVCKKPVFVVTSARDRKDGNFT